MHFVASRVCESRIVRAEVFLFGSSDLRVVNEYSSLASGVWPSGLSQCPGGGPMASPPLCCHPVASGWCVSGFFKFRVKWFNGGE
jgi:hypothetical protein